MKNQAVGFNFENYVYFSRWASYWYQVSLVLAFKPASVLVVGKGDGLVSDLLAKEIDSVKTLDINPDFNPDIVSSVEAMPLADGSFDVVLCAQTLEHLPFESLVGCLKEINRVSRRGAVLSLPYFGPAIKLSFKAPFLAEKKLALKIPWPMKHVKDKEHQWEIGKRGFSESKISRIISRHFEIKKKIIPFENQYHIFYILIRKR